MLWPVEKQEYLMLVPVHNYVKNSTGENDDSHKKGFLKLPPCLISPLLKIVTI